METHCSLRLFLGFLFATCCTISFSADRPSYDLPVDSFIIDCSPSVSSSDVRFSSAKRVKFDYSTVSRVYAIDPSYRDKPKISACIFKDHYSYPLPVSDGPKFIRLFFLPVTYSGLNIAKALFSVSIGQYTLLTTSESYSKHNSDAGYVIKEFCVNIDGQTSSLNFTPSSKISGAYAFVNKIEVVSMPSKLYIQEDVLLPLVGHPSKYSMGKSTALEMMHRLNVGGDSIPELEDISMLRRWARDDAYLMSNEGYTDIIESDIEIKSSSLMPPYIAPIQVYTSARITKNKYNATWLFPVDSGFYYLVRLHFCEILRIEQDGKRVFRVYINNQTADDHADIVRWSHGAGIPIHGDYIVNFSRHGEGIRNLSIVIGSNNGSATIYEGPILNGLEIFKLSDTANNLSGFYPFEIGIQSDFKDGEEHTTLTIVRVVFRIIGSVLLIWFLCSTVYLAVSKFSKQNKETLKEGQSSDHCRIFSISDIKLATNNFTDNLIIGTGGFGTVYKGFLNGGTTSVAIKRANPSSHQGLEEFQTEISMLSKLRHCHLVSLIGYSMEEKEMVLVYDYMAQGTLRDHLYKAQKPPLPWKQRLKICIGAARGLHYLHTGLKHVIIHRDIKSTNILLDDKWVAKVSDFGLSKIGPSAMTQSKTHVSTIVKGSFGYLDPEYYRRQKLTEKSDVYSFGVVLFEVLCARPAVIPMGEIQEEEHEKVNLAEWALHCCQMGMLEQIVDPFLNGKIAPKCFKTFTDIARKCLADKGSERPTMGDILWNLELAMLQQESADFQEEGVQKEVCGRMKGNLSVMIDAQKFVGFDNSDPTPGVEFSEIMVPTGR